jgi:hypothetical protein
MQDRPRPKSIDFGWGFLAHGGGNSARTKTQRYNKRRWGAGVPRRLGHRQPAPVYVLYSSPSGGDSHFQDRPKPPHKPVSVNPTDVNPAHRPRCSHVAASCLPPGTCRALRMTRPWSSPPAGPAAYFVHFVHSLDPAGRTARCPHRPWVPAGSGCAWVVWLERG